MTLLLFRILLNLHRAPKGAPELLSELPVLDEDGGDLSLASVVRELRSAIQNGWVELEGGPGAGPPIGRPDVVFRITARGRSATMAEAERRGDSAAVARATEAPRRP